MQHIINLPFSRVLPVNSRVGDFPSLLHVILQILQQKMCQELSQQCLLGSRPLDHHLSVTQLISAVIHFCQVLLCPEILFLSFHVDNLGCSIPEINKVVFLVQLCTFSTGNPFFAPWVKSSIFCLTCFQFEQVVKEAKLIQLGDGGED